MYGSRFQRNGLKFVRFWLPAFPFLASFLRNLPRKGLEGVAERAFRGRLRADAVYDAAVGGSVNRSLKR